MSRAVRPFEDVLVIGELQKLNKQLSKIVELKKQSNMMSGAFSCVSLPYIWCFYVVRIRNFDLGVVDCGGLPVYDVVICKMTYVMIRNPLNATSTLIVSN